MRFALLIAVSLCFFLGQALGNAQLRFVHAEADAPNLDVYIDDRVVPQWTNLPFQSVTGYLTFPAGDRRIALIRSGATRIQEEGSIAERFASEDIFLNPPVPFNLEAGQHYSLAFFGQRGNATKRVLDQEFPTWAVYLDRIEPVEDQARLRLVHLVPGFMPVSLAVQRNGEDEQEAVMDLAFPMATEYMDLEPGNYNLIIRGGGEELLTVPDVELMSRRVYTAWAFGPPLSPVISQDNA